MRRGRASLRRRAGLALVALLLSRAAAAEDAADWLQRAATAARQQNYAGTLLYQHAGRAETSRLTHMIDEKGEHEKLVNLDGPAREVIRNNEQVRCYYPDAKIIRVEPRTYRNAFPSLLPQQLDTLAVYYFFRKGEMARIAGVNLPLNKRAEIGLTYVFGIGRSTANEILKETGVDPNTQVKDLTEDEIIKLRDAVENHEVEGDLRRERSQNVKRLQEIGSYRGLRHRRGLPVRGQRTKTNARGRKGPRRMSVAGRKKAPQPK